MREKRGIEPRAIVRERIAARGLGYADEGVSEHSAVLRCGSDLDEMTDRLGRLVEHPLHDLRELRVVAGRRAEEHTEGRFIAGNEAKVGGKALLDALATGVSGGSRSRELLEQLISDIFEQLEEERPLGREVLVQDGLRDAGSRGNVIHRRRMESAYGELGARDIEELASALLGRESDSHAAAQTLDFKGIS